MTLTLRAAEAEDAEAICSIYNQGIEDRQATLETTRRTPAERRTWLAARGPRHPVIVAEAKGRVVAWGSLNVFNARPCYDGVADLSIYVAREQRGKGVGCALLGELLVVARRLGYRKLVLAALARNQAGRRLYDKTGFREVGVYREQGRLDGVLVDVLLMEQVL